MNILFCSAGRRCELLKEFRKTMDNEGKIVATDMSKTAPAIYMADKYYLVPAIKSPEYLPTILEICKKEEIQAVTTLIDPEIMQLAHYREQFEEIGVQVLAPYEETAKLCFDKFEMYRFLKENEIPTVLTYGNVDSFKEGVTKGEIDFPVFVKPRGGSGSVGARKVETLQELVEAFDEDSTLIVQEYMGDAVDLDADVYVDTISHKPVSIFSKKKIETKIGGASKTVSFKDDTLVEFLLHAIEKFQFNGPLDVDLFYKDGQYYLSEINPRFGGAYLHAYGAGVDFVKLIQNNIEGKENEPCFHNYDEGVVMMMYDSVVIEKIDL